MSGQPLAEVFGYPVDNMSREAQRCRDNRLCPFGNIVPNCTKDKANNPLGVCSIFEHEGNEVITCPIRFRQNWTIAEDAASFFFAPGEKWTSLTEIRLKDGEGKSADNIDVVLVSYNEAGKVTDFGALEIQAVYISGNVRNPFECFMENPASRQAMDWSDRPNYPRPDYISSSRKRLAPQLIFKGGILKAWGKKTAVVIHRGFFETLPKLEEVEQSSADIGWFVYDLIKDDSQNTYKLVKHKSIFTEFNESLKKITVSTPGKMEDFIDHLQTKIRDKFDGDNPPNTETIDAVF